MKPFQKPNRASLRRLPLFRLALVCAWPLLASADDYYLHTDYENWAFNPGPPTEQYTNYYGSNASTALYGGNVLGNSTGALPTDGVRYGLEWSAFGQAVEGIQSDVSLGSPLTPPPGVDTNQPPANFVAVQVGDNTNAYYVCTDPAGGAFWAPSTHQIIATQPDNITIQWHTTNCGTNCRPSRHRRSRHRRPSRHRGTNCGNRHHGRLCGRQVLHRRRLLEQLRGRALGKVG